MNNFIYFEKYTEYFLFYSFFINKVLMSNKKVKPETDLTFNFKFLVFLLIKKLVSNLFPTIKWSSKFVTNENLSLHSLKH